MLVLFFLLACTGVHGFQVLNKAFWEKSALEELQVSLGLRQNTRVAKNVILFIGDGMGPNTITAARIYSEGEEGFLSWEKFPQVGAIKTYSVNNQVPDSAATATAMYSGVKVNSGTIGVDSTVQRKDCNSSILEENRLVSIAALAQEAGKSTGIVTTTRVTHATPSAMYAHSAERYWECNSALPPGAEHCKDIGRQLVEDFPGKRFNVIMGGGRQFLKGNPPNTTDDPIELGGDECIRTDGRDLMAEWAEGKRSEGVSYAVVENTRSMLEVDIDKTDYLLGVFHNNHLPYDYLRDKSENGVPSLEQMSTTAVKLLMKNTNGFVLMVEGGMIDHAHHDGKARIALSEVIELSKAVNGTMRLLESAGIKEDTLVIVTSDHSHTLSINGHAPRGGDILGIASTSKVDGVPYTVLSYGNGPNYHYKAVNGSVVREDPSTVDTRSFDYGPQSAFPRPTNTHGGSDVFIYASGPYAHLFHNMHEQNYITAVMKFAMRIAEFSKTDSSQQTSDAFTPISSLMLVALVSCLGYLAR